MTGAEMTYAMPIIMGAMGAMSGGAARNPTESPYLLEPFGGAEGEFLDPRRMLAQNVRDTALMGTLFGERAAAPVSLPGSFVQPTQWYGGGGLPFPMGRTAMDPALFQPGEHQYRPGVQFPQPDFAQPDPTAVLETPYGVVDGVDYSTIPDYARRAGLPQQTGNWLFGAQRSPDVDALMERQIGIENDSWRIPMSGQPQGPFTLEGLEENVPGWNTALGGQMGGYGPRRTPQAAGGASTDPTTPEGWMGGTQSTPSPMPAVGGGVPQLMANLELMGVTADPTTGNLVNQGVADIGNAALFSGSGNVRRRFPAGPEPGTGLDQPQWQQPDVGAPLTIPKAAKRKSPGTWGLGPRTAPYGAAAQTTDV